MKIFLIGMMGSGKTYWCQQLGKAFNLPMLDLDDLITNTEQMSINKLFAQKGEDYFRIKEHQLLKSITTQNYVLATGGGTPCFFDSIQWMNEQGITVFIDEPVEIILERLLNEQDKRPLVKGLTKDKLRIFLENKLAERVPFYKQACITFTPQQQNLAELAQQIQEFKKHKHV